MFFRVWQYGSIGSDNGLSPLRPQAIISFRRQDISSHDIDYVE